MRRRELQKRYGADEDWLLLLADRARSAQYRASSEAWSQVQAWGRHSGNAALESFALGRRTLTASEIETLDGFRFSLDSPASDVVELLVASLSSPRMARRRASVYELLHRRMHSRVLLRAYSADVMKALRGGEWSEEDCVLLSWVDLPPEVAERLRRSPKTPDRVKALLGDQVAMRELLRRFRAATEESQAGVFGEMFGWNSPGLGECIGDLAEQVVLLDTPSSWEEIARALVSQRTILAEYAGKASVAYAVLQGWRMARPSEAWLAGIDDCVFGGVGSSFGYDKDAEGRLRADVEAEMLRRTGRRVRLPPGPLVIQEYVQPNVSYVEKTKTTRPQ